MREQNGNNTKIVINSLAAITDASLMPGTAKYCGIVNKKLINSFVYSRLYTEQVSS